MGREYGAKSFPAIILFFNKIPILYKGNAEENDEIVDWLSTQIGVKPIIDEADNFLFPAADAKKVEDVVEEKEEKAVKKPKAKKEEKKDVKKEEKKAVKKEEKKEAKKEVKKDNCLFKEDSRKFRVQRSRVL